MKLVCLLITGFLSLPSFAVLANLEVIPSSPVVISSDATMSDGRLLVGPWFTTTARIHNTSEVTIRLLAIKYQVTSSIQGQASLVQWNSFPFMTVILPGQILDTPVFIDSLMPTEGYVYQVEASVIGWVGQSGSEDRDVATPVTFVTQ